MPQSLVCPQGHRWELDRTDGAAPTCPACGAAPFSQTFNEAQNTVAGLVEGAAAEKPPAKKLSIPGYEILGVLGRGGMGVVYRARHTKLKRLVALKMILAGAHAGPGELERFRLEAEAVARLQHANVVQIHEVGEHEGKPYFALEYVDGGSLRHKLTRTPLPARAAAELAETLARAMHVAHGRGVIHRDLKPANVLLTKDGIPKISDFGLAKQLGQDSGQTHSGQIMGTPSYMAPEQAAGNVQELGPPADIYALGAMLYEMLIGRPPFKAASVLDTLEQVRTQEPVPPSRLQSTTPRDLETICLKCLEKNPRNRYESAEALAEDLRHFLAGEPIQARPVGRLERAVKWVRRRPASALALAAGCAAVLALVVLGASVYYGNELQNTHGELQIAYRNVGEQRDIAEQRRKEAQEQRELVEKREDEVNHQRELAEARRKDADEQRRQVQRLKYAADMNMAMQAFQESQLTRMRDLLDSYGPATKEHKDFVGFEWHYLNRLFHHHALPMRNVLIPGKLTKAHAPFRTRQGVMFAWHLDSSEPSSVKVVLPGPEPNPMRVYAHNQDGSRIVVFWDDAWEVWDWQQQPPARRLRIPAKGVSKEVAMSADGTVVAVPSQPTGRTPSHAVWSISSGQEISLVTPTSNHVALSPDGGMLACELEKQIKVVNTQTGNTRFLLGATMPLPGIHRLYFDPTGQMLAAACDDGSVRLWDTATGAPAQTLWGATRSVLCAAWSPDGRLVAAGGADRHVRVWEAASGALVREFSGHHELIFDVAFSPDGRRLASYPQQTKAPKLWEVTTDQQGSIAVAKNLRGAGRAVFSGDGGQLVWSGRSQAEISSWQLDTGEFTRQEIQGDSRIVLLPGAVAFDLPRHRYAACRSVPSLLFQKVGSDDLPTLAPLPARATLIEYSPDGSRLAYWTRETLETILLVVRPTASGQEWRHQYSWGGDGLAFSADSRYIAVARANKRELVIQMLDAATGRTEFELPSIPKGSTGSIRFLAFRGDSRQLAVSVYPSTIHLFDLETRKEIAVLTGHAAPADWLVYSPDGRRLASASQDGTVRLWDPETGMQVLSLPGLFDFLTFSPDSRLLAATSRPVQPTMLRVWDARPATDAPLHPPTLGTPTKNVPVVKKPPSKPLKLAPHAATVHALGFSPDGTRLVTGDSKAARVWDAQSGQPLATLDAKGPIFRAHFGAGDRLLTVGNKETAVGLWDARSGKVLPALPGLKGVAHEAVFTPDGKRAICFDRSGTITVFDLTAAKVLSESAAYDPKLVLNGLAISPDGSKVCYALGRGVDWSVKVWDLEDNKETLSWKASAQLPVWAVAWSGDGKWIASSGVDKEVNVWHAATGKLHKNLNGPTKTATRVALDPAGRRVAATSMDGVVRVWDLTTGELGPTFPLDVEGLGNLAFSPDGRRLAASAPGIVQIWDLPAGPTR